MSCLRQINQSVHNFDSVGYTVGHIQTNLSRNQIDLDNLDDSMMVSYPKTGNFFKRVSRALVVSPAMTLPLIIFGIDFNPSSTLSGLCTALVEKIRNLS